MRDYDRKFDDPISTRAVPEVELRRILAEGFPESEVSHTIRLSGGFANLNLRVDLSGDRSYVLRLSQRDRKQFAMELALLERLQGVIPVPRVLRSSLSGETPFAVLEFVEGALLSECWTELDRKDVEELLQDVGRTLRKVHSIQFDGSGFLGVTLQIEERFRDFGESYVAYMSSCLEDSRIRTRLGAALTESLTRYIAKNRHLIVGIQPQNRLVHSDFNSKNILVAQTEGAWRVMSLLDWEFSFSGSPLVDFGNFLRFEDELDFPVAEALLRGYGGAQEPDWRQAAAYCNVAAMLTFLRAEEERPKTFQTAKSVLQSTLDRWP